MTARKAKLVLGRLAEDDLAHIAAWAAATFGVAQANAYVEAILDTIDELSRAEPARSKARDEIAPGLRTLHMARRGRRGRYLVLYRADHGAITVLRILHDSMEISHHLPEDEG